MDGFKFDQRRGLRSTWNETRLIRGPVLTDRQIAKYEAQGYYSEEFRAARRQRMARLAANRRSTEGREGNFIRAEDGRLIYSP